MFAAYTSHVPTILQSLPKLALQLLTPSHLIAFYLTLIASLSQLKFKSLSFPPFLAYICSSLRSKNQIKSWIPKSWWSSYNKSKKTVTLMLNWFWCWRRTTYIQFACVFNFWKVDSAFNYIMCLGTVNGATFRICLFSNFCEGTCIFFATAIFSKKFILLFFSNVETMCHFFWALVNDPSGNLLIQ